MKKPLVIIFIVIMLVMLNAVSCRTGGGTDITPVPSGEAPDDIVTVPGGGPTYRANVHQAGEENPWPPIEIAEIYLGSGSDEAHVYYRDHIETRAGETRNNVIKAIIPGTQINSVNVSTAGVTPGITITEGTRWIGPGSIAVVLEIEISPEISPAKYELEISLKIDNRDYGTIPCLLEVVE
jgi:hypothetical protein